MGAASLAVISVCTPLGGCSFSDNSDPRAWVREHACEFDAESGIPADSLGDIKDYDVFLAGEWHGFVENYTLRKALVQGLQRDAGLNCLLLEIGVGAGLMLERYLQTGDESVLALVMAQARGTAFGCQEEEEFWRWLHDRNVELKEAERLHVYGLDIDHQSYLALWALNNIIEGCANVPATASSYLEALASELDEHSVNESPRELLNSRAFEELDSFITQHENDARAYFGGYFDVVSLMVRGHHIVTDIYSSEDGNQSYSDTRDAFMSSAFEIAEREDGERIYFGQFGSAHTVQRLVGEYRDLVNYSTLAMRLCEMKSSSRGVCSIQYAYRDMQGQGGLDLCDNGWSYLEDLESGAALIDLEAEGSPFSDDIDIADDLVGEPTTTCFQKLIVVPGSEQVASLS